MKSDSIKVNAKRKNKRVCTRYEINGQTLTAKKVGKRAKYMDGFVYRYERWLFVWCIFWNSFFLFLCCHCWSEAICGHWRYWISERALLWTLDTHAHMRISSLLLSRFALIVFMWHSCFNNIYRECRQYGDFMSYHKICITRYGNMVMMRVCVCELFT